jgi:hypothetical protein
MRKLFILIIGVLTLSTAAWADIFGQPFSDGSPACTSCHSVAAAGYTVSAWGPDISGLYENMGGDPSAIADFIRSSGIGPMDAVYADSKITDEEIGRLAQAYAGLSAEGASVTGGGSIIIYALLLFMAVLGLWRFIFRCNCKLEENI